jgi:hypothetical protein
LYTPAERDAIRAAIVAAARADTRITGGALTGSAAVDGEDRWSDIDLAFGVADAAALPDLLADFTALMHERHGALHELDVHSGVWIYRVFLLPSTLQVDLAFAPAAEFAARAPTFRLLFGSAAERPYVSAPAAEPLIGYAWLYGLHVRSSLARDKLWQAEYMLSAMRDHVLALACLRHDLPAREGRGFHRLPIAVTRPLEGALVARLEREEIGRAFSLTADGLLREIAHADRDLLARVGPAIRELTTSWRD